MSARHPPGRAFLHEMHVRAIALWGRRGLAASGGSTSAGLTERILKIGVQSALTSDAFFRLKQKAKLVDTLAVVRT